MTAIYDSMVALPHSHFPPSDLSSPLPVIDHRSRTQSPMNEELIRSASFTAIPSPANSAYTPHEDLAKGFALDDLSLPSPTKGGDFSGVVALSADNPEEPKTVERVGRRKSLMARPKSWIQQVKASKDTPERINSTTTEVPPVPPVPKLTRTGSKARSQSFASYARRSWMSSSRSPSPSKARGKDSGRSSQEDDSTPASSISSSSPRTSSAMPFVAEKQSPSRTSKSPVRRASIFLQKKRPRSALFSNGLKSADGSFISINKLPPERRASPMTSTEKLPTIPKEVDLNKSSDSPRRRDELWSAFRGLETDFSKFQTKTSAMKTNVVRASLLPFLRNCAQHPSNKTLRPEDLDRRVNILNKWWTGILEMLEGRSSQMVSGVDRPVLLEAVTLIMMRPEWRLPPSQFAPLSERVFGSPSRNTSSGSLNTSAAQFLTESVYHNVRNMFIQNLLSQMSLVVDKMSMRQTPASLVTFCGKAAAYAFFFCPGVADVLIKVWELPAPTLRRVVEEFGISRRTSRSDFSEDVTSTFPSNLHPLAWVSVASMMKQLHRPANLPLGASKIPWFGPWVTRWRGRDSDLFFVFCKYYHILAEDFMPTHLSLAEKARAPGFVLVHAQILTVMDGTIHRQSSPDQFVNGPLPITFDDVLAGADASVAAVLPLPSNNASRLMAENRLIMLLRDFLSEKSSEFEVARNSFAEAFANMTRGTAKRTSQYDNNACLTLCDFIEEALAIYLRVQPESSSHYNDMLDFPFWLAVCKKMLESQNIMTEMRLFSFIYGSWNILVSDASRKEVICMEWLLAPDTFEKYFCHWCPMVRAYFMRLLCWRVARFEGEASPLDLRIYKTLLDRLKATWVQYTAIRQDAEISSRPLPSTAPCYPAPNRRLLIVRNDNHPPSNLFLGFDGIVAPNQINASTTQPVTTKRASFVNLSRLDTGELASSAAESTSTNLSTPVKKRWNGLIERIVSFGNADTEPSPTQLPLAPSPPRSNTSLTSPPQPTPQIQTQTFLSPSPSVTHPHPKVSIIRSPSASLTNPTPNTTPTKSHRPPPQIIPPPPTPQTDSLTAARAETSLRRSTSKSTSKSTSITSKPTNKSSLPAKSHSTSSSTDSVVSLRGVCTFKFSLEWANNSANNGVGSNGGFGKERRLWDPKLPGPAQGFLNGRGLGISGLGVNLGGGFVLGGVGRDQGGVGSGGRGGLVGKGGGEGGSGERRGGGEAWGRYGKGEYKGNEGTYAGRALSEWALTVQECNNFGERRRSEGVGGWKWIEVPMLGAEGFRKYG